MNIQRSLFGDLIRKINIWKINIWKINDEAILGQMKSSEYLIARSK